MNATIVVGRFVDRNGNGVPGTIAFVPQKLWVSYGKSDFATLSPVIQLDSEGGFVVALTPTHGHDGSPWHYTIHCPVGKWTIEVPEVDRAVQIKELLPSRFKA